MNIKETNDEARRIEAEIDRLKIDPTGVLLVSIKHPDRMITPGVFVEAQKRLAGRLVAEGTHRLATEAEYASYRSETQESLEAAQRRDAILARQGMEAIMQTLNPGAPRVQFEAPPVVTRPVAAVPATKSEKSKEEK